MRLKSSFLIVIVLLLTQTAFQAAAQGQQRKRIVQLSGIVIDEDASVAEQILAEAVHQTALSRFRVRPGHGG